MGELHPTSVLLPLPWVVHQDEKKSPPCSCSPASLSPLGPYWSHLLMQMKSWKWRSKKKKTSNMLVPRDWIRLAPWRLEGRHPRTAAPQQCAEPDTGSEPALNPTKVLSLFWNPPTALLFTNSGRKWQINPFFKRMSRFLVTLCTAQDMIVPSA